MKPIDQRTVDFLQKAKAISQGENLDFSQVVYINNRTKVTIVDHDLRPDGSEWGPFEVTPSNFVKGRRHPERRNERISRAKQRDQEDFIKRCREAHKGEDLDYSKIHYTGAHSKIIVIDNTLDPNGVPYGEFEVEANSFLRGSGHPRKAIDKQAQQQILATDEFIQRLREIHKDKPYSYELVHYTGRRFPVTIVCHQKNAKGVEHGAFSILGDNVLAGKGCPKCGNHISHAETELFNFVRYELGFADAVSNDRSVLDGQYELDIYIPSVRLAIEFNGLLWHSERYGKDRHYHLDKTTACEAQNIQLIHVFEDEYTEHPDLVKDKISRILHKSATQTVIGARQCGVKVIDYKIAKPFLSNNHIQGACRATVYYGLYYDAQLVAVEAFTLRDKNNNVWELVRYATDVAYSIPGGATKIFKHFSRQYQPSEVYTFMDRRWGRAGDNLYSKMNFVLSRILPPNYSYTDGHIRKHKFLFRKQKMSVKYKLDKILTETEMTQSLGFYKIWDCGLLKYVWKP